MAVAHFAGSSFVPRRSWGSASLHPRLYAIAALRGLNEAFQNLFRDSLPNYANENSLASFWYVRTNGQRQVVAIRR